MNTAGARQSLAMNDNERTEQTVATTIHCTRTGLRLIYYKHFTKQMIVITTLIVCYIAAIFLWRQKNRSHDL